MKLTIELTEAQEKGIREYLLETSGDLHPKVTKEDIKVEVQYLLDSVLQCGAVWDYISKYEK